VVGPEGDHATACAKIRWFTVSNWSTLIATSGAGGRRQGKKKDKVTVGALRDHFFAIRYCFGATNLHHQRHRFRAYPKLGPHFFLGLGHLLEPILCPIWQFFFWFRASVEDAFRGFLKSNEKSKAPNIFLFNSEALYIDNYKLQ
jgi:hypothetical protein